MKTLLGGKLKNYIILMLRVMFISLGNEFHRDFFLQKKWLMDNCLTLFLVHLSSKFYFFGLNLNWIHMFPLSDVNIWNSAVKTQHLYELLSKYILRLLRSVLSPTAVWPSNIKTNNKRRKSFEFNISLACTVLKTGVNSLNPYANEF